jgi:hypothetical protein
MKKRVTVLFLLMFVPMQGLLGEIATNAFANRSPDDVYRAALRVLSKSALGGWQIVCRYDSDRRFAFQRFQGLNGQRWKTASGTVTVRQTTRGSVPVIAVRRTTTVSEVPAHDACLILVRVVRYLDIRTPVPCE